MMNWTEVFSYIYVGKEGEAALLQLLIVKGVTTVLVHTGGGCEQIMKDIGKYSCILRTWDDQ